MFYRAIRIKGVEYQLAVNLSGKGAPTTSTEGLLGMVYMDEDTGDLYRCISAADTGYIWKKVAEGGEIDTTLAQAGKAADAAVVGERFDKISKEKADKAEIPKVFGWASAELPFTEAQISGTVGGAGFVVNPTNFADGKTYFRYHGGATNFTWTNPNPQKGAVTITVLSWRQWDTSAATSSKLNIVYSDGTTAVFTPKNGVASTYTTDANKTLTYIKGNYDIENWVLLDMSVMSIVADYPAPTGTVKTVNGVEPDENGNVKIDIPESSGGTDISLGMTGAAVGQIARITAVDENGVPTKWEPADKNEQVSLLAETDPLTENAASIGITGLELTENGYMFRITGANGNTGSGLDIIINGIVCIIYRDPGSSIFISLGKINGKWKLNVIQGDIRTRIACINVSFSGVLNSVVIRPHYVAEDHYFVNGSKLMIYKGLSDVLFVAD